MPQLQDPNFSQTTTLLAEYTAEGALGIVLNRPLELNLYEIMPQEESLKEGKPIPVYCGGPVQGDRGWLIHEEQALEKESLEIEPGLYLTSSAEALKKLLKDRALLNAPRFRFFLGYAGWGPAQLESEIASASWVTAPIQRDLIFDPNPLTLWKRSLSSIGIDPIRLAATPQTEAN